MKNTKHTPAPWSFTQVGVFDSKDEKICSMERNDFSYFKERYENLANAKLIASAPELLEALIEIKKWGKIKDGKFTFTTSEIQFHALIENAIKKATE